MHTRQDRWIQKELAFTPAKNATQPNPFKIISLQSTRKENNRETEKTLARAAVTLETEWAKWPNPWCLWWWWWWWWWWFYFKPKMYVCMKSSCTLISLWDTYTIHWKKRKLETETTGWKYGNKYFGRRDWYRIYHLRKKVANICKLYWSC